MLRPPKRIMEVHNRKATSSRSKASKQAYMIMKQGTLHRAIICCLVNEMKWIIRRCSSSFCMITMHACSVPHRNALHCYRGSRPRVFRWIWDQSRPFRLRTEWKSLWTGAHQELLVRSANTAGSNRSINEHDAWSHQSSLQSCSWRALVLKARILNFCRGSPFLFLVQKLWRWGNSEKLLLIILRFLMNCQYWPLV